MKRNLIATYSLVLLLGGASVGLSAPASAATAPSAGTGLIGACNMKNGFTADGGGMATAMDRAADQGAAGMYRSLHVSGCR